jgi:hypothetical protein
MECECTTAGAYSGVFETTTFCDLDAAAQLAQAQTSCP